MMGYNQMGGSGGPNPNFQNMGDFMNRGMGPSNMIFPNQNGTTSPNVRRERG